MPTPAVEVEGTSCAPTLTSTPDAAGVDVEVGLVWETETGTGHPLVILMSDGVDTMMLRTTCLPIPWRTIYVDGRRSVGVNRVVIETRAVRSIGVDGLSTRVMLVAGFWRSLEVGVLESKSPGSLPPR